MHSNRYIMSMVNLLSEPTYMCGKNHSDLVIWCTALLKISVTGPRLLYGPCGYSNLFYWIFLLLLAGRMLPYKFVWKKNTIKQIIWFGLPALCLEKLLKVKQLAILLRSFPRQFNLLFA